MQLRLAQEGGPLPSHCKNPGFVLDFVYKIPGVSKEFSRTRNWVFEESIWEDFYAIHSVSVFSFPENPTMIFVTTSCKLSARAGTLIFGSNVSLIVLESWFTNLEHTPINRCLQLPTPYKLVPTSSAQVVERSFNVISNSPSQDYTHPDDRTLLNYATTYYCSCVKIYILVLQKC